MIYNLNSDTLSDAYNVDGESLNTAYDKNGNIVFQKGSPSIPVGDLSERHDVLFTQGKIYVFYDGVFLYRSMDGITIDKTIDVSSVGIIKNIHVFTDGTLNIFGHQKAYYSHDWQTLHESTVLNSVGEPYVPTQYDTFTVTGHANPITVVDGTEMYVFANYCITDEYNQKKNIWYTTDKGRTYKSAFEFGVSKIGSTLISIRHVHRVLFNPADSSFWITTGDANSESYVIKGFYNPANDTWSWNILGNGYDFKWSGMTIYGNEIYWALDHTPGEVRKCGYSEQAVADVNSHVSILTGTPNDCITIVIDPDTGEMLVGLSIYGGGESTCRRLYYSADRLNFEYMTGNVPSYYPHSDTMYYGVYAMNADKKILSGLWSRATKNLADWDKVPSIWLDDVVRTQFPNAFPIPSNN